MKPLGLKRIELTKRGSIQLRGGAVARSQTLKCGAGVQCCAAVRAFAVGVRRGSWCGALNRVVLPSLRLGVLHAARGAVLGVCSRRGPLALGRCALAFAFGGRMRLVVGER